MTLIPSNTRKFCFAPCPDDTVKSGQCSCINNMKSTTLNESTFEVDIEEFKTFKESIKKVKRGKEDMYDVKGQATFLTLSELFNYWLKVIKKFNIK